MYEIIRVGKQGLDGFISELGSMVVEAIMDMEREERSGPEYHRSLVIGHYLLFVIHLLILENYKSPSLKTFKT
jgi:hypothetical protein